VEVRGRQAAPADLLFRLVQAALPPAPGEKEGSLEGIRPPNLPTERQLRKSCHLRVARFSPEPERIFGTPC